MFLQYSFPCDIWLLWKWYHEREREREREREFLGILELFVRWIRLCADFILFYFLKFDMAVVVDVAWKIIFFYYSIWHIKFFHQWNNGRDSIDMVLIRVLYGFILNSCICSLFYIFSYESLFLYVNMKCGNQIKSCESVNVWICAHLYVLSHPICILVLFIK